MDISPSPGGAAEPQGQVVQDGGQLPSVTGVGQGWADGSLATQRFRGQVGPILKGLRRLVQLIRQQKFKINEFSLFLCQQLAFLSEKLIL